MNIAGILLIAIAVTIPQSRPTRPSEPTSTAIDRRPSCSPSAASAASPLCQRRDPWHEFLLKQFNPDHIDYGSWLEQRRRTLLQASVRNPYFNYSAGVTLGLLLMTLLVVKQWVDHRRWVWITAEMMTDLYNHDAYSRQIARQAIERYNDHIERSNRAVEASDHSVPATDSEANRLRSEVQLVSAERESYRLERDLAKQELVEKERVLADMSLRLDALVKGANSGRNPLSKPQLPGADEKLVQHTKTLQQQLFAESRAEV